jgi:peptidoglycan/xylan/chitin deacetylase (PgdA/CDA1 family)
MEGYPVFEYEKSLANKRAFIPSDDFIRSAVSRYDASKTKAENLSTVQKLAAEHRAKQMLGRFESDEERLARIEKELLGTKQSLEEVTGKPVEYLVYPGGGHTPETDQLAFEYGYKLLSKGTTPNAFGSKLRNVQRFTGYYPFKPKALSALLNMQLIRFQLARGQGSRAVHGLIQTAKRFL